MESRMNVNHFPEMNRQIRRVLLQHTAEKFPFEINFNCGMEHPQFKITIEKNESDIFVDKLGNKWKKVNEE